MKALFQRMNEAAPMTTQDHIPTELPSAEMIAAVNIYTATPSAAPSQVDEVRRLREALSMFVDAAKPRRQDGYHEMPMFSARELEIARQALASSSGG